MPTQWRVIASIEGREIARSDLHEGIPTIAGRDPEVGLVIAQRSVSRRHCQLTAQSNGVLVRDLGSANGVRVRTEPVSEILLDVRERCQIGLVELRIESCVPQSAPEAQKESGELPPDDAVLSTAPGAYAGLEKERLALLIEASKNLSSTTDTEEVLERILDVLPQLMPLKRAVIVLEDEDGTLRTRSARPKRQAEELDRVFSRNIVREVMRTGEPRIIADASMDEGFQMALSVMASDIKAAVCAPLIARTRSIGAVYADYPGRAALYDRNALEFLGAFAGIAAIALENARMLEELRERERLQRDLEIAAEIQRGLLPELSPEIPGIEMAWTYRPSRQVGGDFYDVHALPDGRLVMLLGDVSGKSIGAALFMARLVSFVRAILLDDSDPARILERTNDLLGVRKTHTLFATTAICVYDPRTRKLHHASAGHLPILLIPPKGDVVSRLGPRGLPLGIDPTAKYVEAEVTLEPGTTIALYTDGLLEARAGSGEQYGFERFERELLSQRSSDLGDLAEHLCAEADRFAKGATFLRDDLAVLLFRAH